MYNAVYYDEFGIHLNLKGLEKWSAKVDERLAAIEENIKPEVVFDVEKMRVLGDEIGMFNGSFVSEKLYNKLEEKHEADCRLISEYDLELKKLEKQNAEQNVSICDLYSNLCTEQKERIRCEAVVEDWKKRYNELEYMYEKKDAENNKLEYEIDTLNKQIDSFGLTCRLHEKEIKDLKSDVERWVERYERLRSMDKSRLFDLKNVENERDHYKGLYSSKCDDYDSLLAKQIKTQKERDEYKELFHSLNHKHQKLVGEMKAWKERAMEAEKPDKLRPVLERENKALRETLEHVTEDRDKLKSECYIAQENLKITKEKLKETEEKFNDACVLNKAREDVYYANIKLQKTIEAKDREVDLLRAELDKYKTDDECDDRWID